MERIMIFDPSLVSENMGDRIIMDYCTEIISEIFDDCFIASVPTHDIIGERTYIYSKLAKYRIVCGTNLINNRMNRRRQWRISLLDSFHINNLCLMGVGWWQYEDKKPNFYTRKLLSNLLGRNCLHSVRDEYTKFKLQEIGFSNVINTACPTMWKLTPDHCMEIPTQKAERVITTLTDYKRDPIQDKTLLEILLKRYKECYLWIQSYDDYEYLKTLNVTGSIHIIPPSLRHYDKALHSGQFDYVGTRLHAGIRALNNKVRTIIVAVDNRATEIAKDTKLNVVDRKDIGVILEALICSGFNTMIKLPTENIEKWKRQFSNE